MSSSPSPTPGVDPSAFERQLEERLRALADSSTPIQAYIAPPTVDELESRYQKLMEKNKKGSEGSTEKELEERMARLKGDTEKSIDDGELEARLAKLTGDHSQLQSKPTDSLPIDEVDELVQQVTEEVHLDNGVRSAVTPGGISSDVSSAAAVTASSTPNSNFASQSSSSSPLFASPSAALVSAASAALPPFSVHPAFPSSAPYSSTSSPESPNADEVASLMKQLQSLPSSQLALHTNVLKNVGDSDDEDEEEDEDEAAVNEIVAQAKDEVAMGLGDGDDEDPIVAAALAELNKVEKENKRKKQNQAKKLNQGNGKDSEPEKGKKKRVDRGKKDKDCIIQ